MIEIIKKLFRKQKEPIGGAFFGATSYEMDNLICGIGKSKILKSEIKISKYPFKPSVVFPYKKIKADEITAICFESYPPLIQIDNEVIIISREKSDSLKKFAERNNTKTFKETNNWNWILKPYVDNEYTEEDDIKMTGLLKKNGISKYETEQIRNEVEKQMYKYNFDTMLWDWFSLGLQDVLAAMRVKYNDEEFADFYKRAMDIELRGKTT